MKKVNIFRICILFVLSITIILESGLIAKNTKDSEAKPKLTLVNNTSFELSFTIKRLTKEYSQLGTVGTLAHYFPDLFPEISNNATILIIIPKLLPFTTYSKNLDIFNYIKNPEIFLEISSPEWPEGRKIIVKIPKPKGPNFAPFWEEEHEIYGETIGIDYSIKKCNKKDPNAGCIITFYEEEALTENPDEGPSSKVEELRQRNKVKNKQEL